jgi:hypothetical protein
VGDILDVSTFAIRTFGLDWNFDLSNSQKVKTKMVFNFIGLAFCSKL